MKKLLINCKFGHYPNGTYELKENYALIINISSEDIIEIEIYSKLKELNFKLQEHCLKSFTAQLI